MTWSIIITAGSREKRLAAALKEAGVETFLPLKRTWKGKFARHAEIRRPAVPGYVFAVIQPHQIHAFHADGAVRLLAPSRLGQIDVDRCINGWIEHMALGGFDDPKPREAVRVRNRGSRRAKREAMSWADGLRVILSELTEEEPLAA